MVISLFAGTIFSWDMARATLMGGAITMLLTIHMAWRLQKLNNHANSQVMLYIGAVERFVLVLVLFASGFSLLILEPLGMITGFIAIQLVQLIIRQQ
jgi:F0F1-type ATP synthase assembly protein I